MSWDSVVDDTPPALAVDTAGPALTPGALPPASAPLGGIGPVSAGIITPAPHSIDDITRDAPLDDRPLDLAPISFAPLTLDTPIVEVPPAPVPAPAAPLPAASTGPIDPAPFAPSLTLLAPTAPAGDDLQIVAQAAASAPVAPAPSPSPATDGAQIPVAPAFPASPVAPASAVPAPVAGAVISTDLPVIVEATPVVSLEQPAAGAGPRLPEVTPPVRRASAQATLVESVPTPTIQSVPRRRRRRRGLKLAVLLVVLAALVAAGVVYGRQYLVPSDWDSVTQPFADAVEAGRAVDFAEPISVIAEPEGAYTERMVSELTGEWAEDQAMWRALGLLSGSVTEQTVADLLEGWQDATYSTEDGNVYHDDTVTGPQLDARITQEMVAASLDQQFRWSRDQKQRTLDDAAQTLATVAREAERIQRSSTFAAELDPIEPAVLTFLPPVMNYRVLAPAVYAEFTNPTATDTVPLGDLGVGGPGPLPTAQPAAAPAAVVVGDDTVSGSPRSMDRSFWYMAFAGFLPTRDAYAASEAVVDNSVAIADRAGIPCVYATFAGGDVTQTATLRTALLNWTAGAPAEFASSFSVLEDGTLQLVSCDPGDGFEAANRIGVARELLGWRSAEIATMEAIADLGGGPSELAAAWAAVEASDAGPNLAALPADTTPESLAESARGAVRAVLVPGG
jgi:hypothetical protein